jgi:hypothetical protein
MQPASVRALAAAGALLAMAAGTGFANDPAPVAWSGITEIAAGGADKGPWRQNDSHDDNVDDATVALASAGGIEVARVDQNQQFLAAPAGARQSGSGRGRQRQPAGTAGEEARGER